jgi:hypothetical protein
MNATEADISSRRTLAKDVGMDGPRALEDASSTGGGEA